MNFAILRKTIRDYALLFAIVLTGIVVFEVVVVRMVIEIAKDLELVEAWISKPFVRSMLRLALGADLSDQLTPNTLTVLGLAHPMLYSLTWILMLTIATGVTVGEISRGTADLVLTLPVSRAAVYLTTSAVWAGGAVLASLAPHLGLWIGEHVFRLGEPLNHAGLRAVLINYCALNLSIAAVAMCISSCLTRRGTAIGIMIAGLLVSDFISLLSQFWPPVARVSFVGFLHYYRPLPVLRNGAPPAGDMTVLLGVGLVAWLIGLVVFTRRDIPAA